jgi:hypothetical protein
MVLLVITSLCVSSFATALPVTVSQTLDQGMEEVLDDICSFFNVIEIPDPAGDATPGAPAYVDILGLTIRQWGQYVQFEWLAGGNVVNDELSYYVLAIDTDRNPETGQSLGGAGAELKISIETFPDGPSALALLAYIDADGQTVLKIERDVPVVLTDSGFILNIEKTRISADHFDLNFLAQGPWYDQGQLTEIQLQPAGDPVNVRIESLNTVLESKPGLINIPQKSTGVQLSAFLVSDGSKTPVEPSQVSYYVSHQDAVPNPQSIISIDAGGVAHYNSEGYVTAWGVVDACQFASEQIILATGDHYGDPLTDDVIAVFPTDYVPPESTFSFGDLMTNYPNYLHTLNVAYDITSDLYHGFIPLNGDKQILAPLVKEGHCGAAGNPLATAPCCYMDCGTGEPAYGVVIHEMGHNFQIEAPGMAQFLEANDRRFGNAFAPECIASFPVIYFINEISLNGDQYGLGPGTYEWTVLNEAAQNDRIGWDILEEFEVLLDTGQSTGIFDVPGSFDSVALFCIFFQAYMYDYNGFSTPYDHEMIRRFLNIFDKDMFPGFQEDKVETYFAAAFSVSAGSDEREQLRLWGFTIDDEFYDQIEPMISAKLTANDDIIFQDNFEGEDNPNVQSPIIISSSPASPADDNNPEIIGSAEAGTIVNLYSNNTCSNLLASGTADEFNTTGITINVIDDSVTTVYATATDDIGTVSPCSTTFVTYTEVDCNIGAGTWAAEARDCTSSDCELFEEGRYRSWDGKIWCRTLITQEFENWTVAVLPGTTTFDFWADWGAWDLAGCGDGVTSISIPVCGLNETINRDGVEQHFTCDVTGQSSIVIEKEPVPCEYVIIGKPHFY